MPILGLDLEGPLSGQDNAYELLSTLPEGRELFEVISRYDDLLALSSREGYEPGDTLKLILPFLLAGGLKRDQIDIVSRKATLTPGALDVVRQARARDWNVYVISTSYANHAWNITSQLGISQEHVFCTVLPEGAWEGQFEKKDIDRINEAKRGFVSGLYSPDLTSGEKDEEIQKQLDEFYWQILPRLGVGKALSSVEVRGGRRKAWAIEQIARANDATLRTVAFVGDSITDARVCQLLEAIGSMAIVFNGNKYVLPYGTVGVASDKLSAVLPVLDKWADGGRVAAQQWVTSNSSEGYAWIPGHPDLSRIVGDHQKTRLQLRQQAAQLG